MAKEKYSIEFPLGTVSPSVLWGYIGTPNGLSNWFADDVTHVGKHFTFIWNKIPQEAEQTGCRTGVFIRFKWKEDEGQRVYFEFKISQNELTGGTVLEITDFAEPEDRIDSIDLWGSQVDNLKRRVGVEV